MLGQQCWPDLDGRSVTVLVPLGALEQHGPHLPLDTDTRIATAVVDGVRGHGDATLYRAPELAYGASGEHEGFPGTVSIGHEALYQVLLEYGRSACRWADRLVFVNGHGGNGPTLRSAVTRLRYEGRDVAWFPCVFDGARADAHAGYTETSVLLSLSPQLVRQDRLEAGNRASVATLLPAMREGGVAAVSANGVLGDPTTASAEDGTRLLAATIARCEAALDAWNVDEQGRLG
ncbi:Creatinine amidohydrolase [Gordonia bronchialis]|nr:mycofactocin biosynthesis peptidyl-dipeptidase MftE [Gordonia bronchialis]STQ65904.1 Creatinine amidohydrolase [Gordonia bronchialis]